MFGGGFFFSPSLAWEERKAAVGVLTAAGQAPDLEAGPQGPWGDPGGGRTAERWAVQVMALMGGGQTSTGPLVDAASARGPVAALGSKVPCRYLIHWIPQWGAQEGPCSVSGRSSVGAQLYCLLPCWNIRSSLVLHSLRLLRFRLQCRLAASEPN